MQVDAQICVRYWESMGNHESDETLDSVKNVDTNGSVEERKHQKNQQPTPRQRAFFQGHVMEGKNMRQAALDAGYSPNTAKNAREAIVDHWGFQQILRAHLTGEDWVEGIRFELWQVLRDAKKPADRIAAIRMWSELTGAKVPDKVEVTEVREEREKEYREVLDLVKQGAPDVVANPPSKDSE